MAIGPLVRARASSPPPGAIDVAGPGEFRLHNFRAWVMLDR
jgi:hypothetical protein